MVWNYVKGLGNKACWQGLGWELVEGRLGSNTEGVQRYTLEFELSLVSGSHRGSWQENGVGRSDLGKHTLEVRSPGRGSGTGRGLHLNRGLWVWSKKYSSTPKEGRKRKTELLVKVLVFHRCLHPYTCLTVFCFVLFFSIYSCVRLWKRN